MALAISEYFGHVTDVVKTFWEGLSVTLSYMLRRPITTQYPDRVEKRIADTLPVRYRGLLEVDMNVCTGCMACERACPIAVIKISTDKDPSNPKQRVITQFDIDEAKCMFCGLCTEPCPTGRHPAHPRVRRHHEVRREPGLTAGCPIPRSRCRSIGRSRARTRRARRSAKS